MALAACVGGYDPTAGEVPPDSRRWMDVFSDSNYTVAVDVGNLVKTASAWEDEYEIWYRTQHHRPRLRRGELWDLEYTRSVVRCDSLWYKILSVDLSDGGRRTVSQQRTGYMEQSWRRIDASSSERLVALRACDLARSHATVKRLGR